MQQLKDIPRFEEWMKMVTKKQFPDNLLDWKKDIEDLKDRETKSCPNCDSLVNDPQGKEFLRNVGECANCDNVRSDI